MKKMIYLAGFLLLLPLTGVALDLGDKAPSLGGITTWIGEPVDPSKPDGKTLTVVEFWATWCPPCRQTIPHLNELNKKYAEQGVVIVGVTTEDEKTVREFQKEVPMEYRVALDTNSVVAAAYMKDIDGIPHAFIINREGVVVWHGHPMNGLGGILDTLIAGTFDPEKTRRAQEREATLMDALQKNDAPKALATLDEMIGEDSDNLELYQMKAGLLLQTGDLATLAKHFAKMEEQFNNSVPALNDIAWMLAAPSPLPLPQRDLAMAWRMAKRANEMSGWKDPAILDTMAMVFYTVGLPERAVAMQEKALAMNKDPEQKADLNSMLEFYRRVVSLRKQILDSDPE